MIRTQQGTKGNSVVFVQTSLNMKMKQFIQLNPCKKNEEKLTKNPHYKQHWLIESDVTAEGDGKIKRNISVCDNYIFLLL